ncbi:MAG: LysR family transcriptional regulator, partial [Oxalobacteraceae bacterium]
VAGGAVDVAIRIGGGLVDTSAAMRKLVDNVRVAVAAPAYLDQRGRPLQPDDLIGHDLLRYGDAVAPWRLIDPEGSERLVPAPARMRVDNGDAVHDWCIAGHGIMLKSMIDVADDVSTGKLERVLPEWTAGEMPIVALFPDRATMPRKTRVFLDAMVRIFETAL